ncbi:hypothetical protein K9L05_04220 [Candidatus Babeliales bacterium]|nr:hypothetical protein [Candidatus Babeliales bacterium]MCF7899818.1 hypothetical protein [Candidatus Babeliales bacterium]
MRLVSVEKIILFLFLVLNINISLCKTVDSEYVFKKWVQIQHVLSDIDVRNMEDSLNVSRLQDLSDRYATNLHFFKTLIKFFNLKTNNNFEKMLFESQLSYDRQLKENISKIYELINKDFPAFIKFLKENGFSKINSSSEEEKININILEEKYNLLLTLLFIHQDPFKAEKIFFALGNKVFDYCFYPETFPQYKELITNKNFASIARLLISFLHKTLVSLGWRWWHQNCLQGIKAKTDNGAELVYIAGGCDIYTPIKEGIYNIRIIDPILPTQEQFYIPNYQWLVEPEVLKNFDDKIEFIFDDKKIVLKRTEHKILGKFKAKIQNNQTIEIPESVTTWIVQDYKTLKELGKIVFERRFAKQRDFVIDKNKVILMSFTEILSAIEKPIKTKFGIIEQGWGIDVNKFDNNFSMYIKQLKLPVNKQILQNMQWMCEHEIDLAFIKLSLNPA